METEIHVFPSTESAISNWNDGTRCDLDLTLEGMVLHTADVAGLRSLTRHCLTLAQEGQENYFDDDADAGWFETEDFGLRISPAWD